MTSPRSGGEEGWNSDSLACPSARAKLCLRDSASPLSLTALLDACLLGANPVDVLRKLNVLLTAIKRDHRQRVF